MDEIMPHPHKLVLDRVRKKWASERSKGFFRKLLELGEIKPVAIEIVQTDSLDERTKLCTGETLNRWRYDDAGLQLLPLNADTSKQKLGYCYYCIDKEKKKLAIVWANILPIASRRKKIHYFHTGEVYEIIERDGVEDYKPISCWIE